MTISKKDVGTVIELTGSFTNVEGTGFYLATNGVFRGFSLLGVEDPRKRVVLKEETGIFIDEGTQTIHVLSLDDRIQTYDTKTSTFTDLPGQTEDWGDRPPIAAVLGNGNYVCFKQRTVEGGGFLTDCVIYTPQGDIVVEANSPIAQPTAYNTRRETAVYSNISTSFLGTAEYGVEGNPTSFTDEEVYDQEYNITILPAVVITHDGVNIKTYDESGSIIDSAVPATVQTDIIYGSIVRVGGISRTEKLRVYLNTIDLILPTISTIANAAGDPVSFQVPGQKILTLQTREEKSYFTEDNNVEFSDDDGTVYSLLSINASGSNTYEIILQTPEIKR